MIELVRGNLLEANTEALVNTVNCVGVMGKGIALQFRQAFPENFKRYKKACDLGEVKPGTMYVFDRGGLASTPSEPRYIINFPTKTHWRGKSKIEYVITGLEALVHEVKALNIRSIAIPPLGCGNGGLDWNDVRPQIEAAFADLMDVHVRLYEPGHAPKASALRVRTKKPRMTRARALFLRLIDMYQVQDYELSLLEIQKLAYFLQESGVPLKLGYQRGQYGPYADNLNHALQHMEGHYIQGYGDRGAIQAAIHVLPGALDDAAIKLQQEPEKDLLLRGLQRVEDLIMGFETPYGLELLATIHWLFKVEPTTVTDVDAAVAAFQAWSDRKKIQFHSQHITVAWYQLHEAGWAPSKPVASA